MKSFRKVAARTTLAVLMTLGAVTPLISPSAQLPVNPSASVTQLVEAPEKAATELSFTRVADVEALAKEYPVLAKLPAELREYDEQQGGDNPAYVEIAKHADKATGREMLFVHVTTPVLCSYEGCPLSVFLKDGKDFRNVLQINAADPITIVTDRDQMAVVLPGAYGVNPGLEYRFNAKSDLFEHYKPAAQAQPERPAPEQAPAPKQ